MKQILHKLRVLLLIVWGMCIPSLPGYAMTDSEFATWTGVRVGWQLNLRVKFRGTFQTRTQNGLKEMERGRLNVGLNYRVLPLMQLKGYYEIQYRDRGTAGWKVGHRYQAGFIVSGAKRNIKLGWRELLQHTFIGGANEVQLRSRLRVAYEPENWIAYPYFFCGNVSAARRRGFLFAAACPLSFGGGVALFPGKLLWMYIIAANMT